MSGLSEEDKAKRLLGNPGHITLTLCEAYRGALDDKVAGLEKNLVRMESRQWALLTGTILTILLTILSIYVNS